MLRSISAGAMTALKVAITKANVITMFLWSANAGILIAPTYMIQKMSTQSKTFKNQSWTPSVNQLRILSVINLGMISACTTCKLATVANTPRMVNRFSAFNLSLFELFEPKQYLNFSMAYLRKYATFSHIFPHTV